MFPKSVTQASGGSSFLREEDHPHASSGPGEEWVRMRPIRAQKCLEHCGQDNGAVVARSEEPLSHQDLRAACFLLASLVR